MEKDKQPIDMGVVERISNEATQKINNFKNNRSSFMILSALAGMYVGVAVILSATVGAALPKPFVYGANIVQGLSFGIALSLVVMAGSELFTGNNMIMTIGLLKKTVRLSETLKFFWFNWIGNFIGSAVLGTMFVLTGLADGELGQYIIMTTNNKVSLTIMQLIFCGILCNFLVCVAVWCSKKMTSESGKLIIICMCLFAFITSGFEHSVANMTAFTMGVLLSGGEVATIIGCLYNLFFVTIGNMLGGILFVALPYFIADTRESNKKS